VFNQGYTAGAADPSERAALCEEALRLARALGEVASEESEVAGLHALLALHHARRAARHDDAGAFVQSPLTTDYAAAGMFLNAMDPDIMPVQGTDLGAALRVSLDALGQGARDAGVVVLVTDGEDHEATFEEQLERAASEGVQVHVVGIGSVEGVPIPIYDAQGRRDGFVRDEAGTVVTTRLGEETLRTVAERTGARYVTAGAGGVGFDDLVDELAGVEGEALEERQVTRFEEQFQMFLAMALALLFVEWVWPERRRVREAWAGRFE
jgi:Ca-activated chloride channel family protein